MALSRIATVLGGLLISKGGRRLAGRHAGKLALATLAFELYQQHRRRQGVPPTTGAANTGPSPDAPRPSSRTRWSGRRV